VELGAAIRRDEYSDFGTATKPKVSLRWQPTQSFMFRAGWGEGFRAPGLNQLYQQTTAGFAAERLSDPLRCGRPGQITALDCNNQFRTRSGGNPNLKPEESEQTTLGVLWEPFKNLATEFTFWKINKYRDITTLSPVVIVANIGRFSDLIVREPQSASDRANNLPGLIDYISTAQNNIGQTKLDGFDFDVRYSLPTKSAGRFGAQLSSTYLRKYRSQLDGLTFTQMAGKFINTTPLPQWKHNLSFDWSRAAWYARASLNYTGKYEDSGPNALTGQALIISDWTTMDLFVSYSGLMRGLKLNAGVKNVFDLNPPFARGSVFAPGWDVFTHDPRGRVITLSANYRF
jgi:iron complex outermembrane recepter protein